MSTMWSVPSGKDITNFYAQNTTEPLYKRTTEPPEELSALDKILLISDDQRILAEKILQPMKYASTVLAIPLAVLNVLIFSQKEMRCASGTYVIALNVGQLFYVVATTIDDVWFDASDQPFSQFSWCLFGMYVSIYGGLLVAKRGSYVILCLASIERLYAVIRPLHVKNFLLSKRPLLCVLIVYAVSAVWHVYFLARSRLVMQANPQTGETLCLYPKTDLYLKTKEVNDAIALAARITLSYTSLALQLLLNVLTIWALRRHNVAARHVQSSANEEAKRKQERQLTITLLGASASFLLLSLPTALFNVFATSFPEFYQGRKYSNLFVVLGQVTYNLTVLGCGVDFFCYLGLSSKFRNTLRQLFLGRKHRSGIQESKIQTVASDVSEVQSSRF
ncbi:hypothetical protein BaRGS_00026769 [Batillaria attramentaria]|uniref:G-protein coupled receptors family 1 profile domain-containing protein n=1 Tax=Batillaria attramentaria TaxID=370345 RepID=A0ABD0K556_9CAEN